MLFVFIYRYKSLNTFVKNTDERKTRKIFLTGTPHFLQTEEIE